MKGINEFIGEKLNLSNMKNVNVYSSLSNELAEILLPDKAVSKYHINNYDDFIKALDDWIRENDMNDSETSLFKYNIRIYAYEDHDHSIHTIINDHDFLKHLEYYNYKAKEYSAILKSEAYKKYEFHPQPTNFIALFAYENRLLYSFAIDKVFFVITLIKDEYGPLG